MNESLLDQSHVGVEARPSHQACDLPDASSHSDASPSGCCNFPSAAASCIYEGIVTHQRFSPVEHAFKYKLFMMYLDLSEVGLVFRSRWFWSSNRSNVARLRRADHFGDPKESLHNSVRNVVREQSGIEVNGPIRMLTQLRYFGYVINPVCFYYCFDPTGQNVEAVLAEVTNTPWGDKHCYTLPGEVVDSDTTFEHEKTFHVSPFMPMDMTYRWRVSSPRDDLSVRLENYQNGNRIHAATLSLKRRPITSWNLTSALVRHPFMTVRVLQGIYWQALRLKLKGAPFFPHPNTQN